MKDFFVFFKMAPSAIFYLFSFRSSVLTKIEGYFNFYTCEMMIFCEQNLICATLKLRPNSLSRPRGHQFICLERKTLLDGVAKWIVLVYLTSSVQYMCQGAKTGETGFPPALIVFFCKIPFKRAIARPSIRSGTIVREWLKFVLDQH